MLKVILTRGTPGSGKSTWAKQFVLDNPGWIRISNDIIREMINGSVFGKEQEALVSSTRLFMIKEGLKRGFSIIVDNVNSSNKHWDDCVSIAKSSGKDVEVSELPFYVDLPVAIERDSLRTGAACVGPEVVERFWKQLGGKSFKNYVPKKEIFTAKEIKPIVQDERLPRAIICDIDGTFAIIGDRSVYDASRCDIVDTINKPVLETVLLFHKAGYKIIFCSGREENDREPTVRFIDKHLIKLEQIPSVYGSNDGLKYEKVAIPYELFMRVSNDKRKDYVVKEEIFRENIEGKYNVSHIYDDRNSVISHWRKMGLTVFQVADGDF